MPRRVRKASNGLGTPPTAFCRKASFSFSASSCRMIAAPPITSECPLMYLVVECTTMSKPCSSGRWIQGEANVLSHTASSPRLRAIAATACRSTSLRSGLVGDSTHSILVSGLIAFSSSSVLERSTKLACSPALRFLTPSKIL